MKRTSIRDLHINTSKWVAEAEEGNTVVIERRGEPVAELRPLRPQPTMTAEKKARMSASMEKLWARMPQVGDSAELLEDDRNR